MRPLILFIKLYVLAWFSFFTTNITTDASNEGGSYCAESTIEKDCWATNGQKCIFPFKWNGVTHSECTVHGIRDPGLHWCSTEVDENGVAINGAHCSLECPVEDGCWATNGRKCLFPFKDWKGVTHHQCTWKGSQLLDGHAWCGTEKNSNKYNHSTWGNCGPGCLIPGT